MRTLSNSYNRPVSKSVSSQSLYIFGQQISSFADHQNTDFGKGIVLKYPQMYLRLLYGQILCPLFTKLVFVRVPGFAKM